MTEEPWRALFGRLLMCPPTRSLTAEQARLARGEARFLAKARRGHPELEPSGVPDAVASLKPGEHRRWGRR